MLTLITERRTIKFAHETDKRSSGLRRTGQNTDFVELVYSLNTKKCIYDSDVSLKDMLTTLMLFIDFEKLMTIRRRMESQLLPRGKFYARTVTKAQGNRLLQQELVKMYRQFDGYGKNQMLLAVTAYNVGPNAMLGTSKRPRSRPSPARCSGRA